MKTKFSISVLAFTLIISVVSATSHRVNYSSSYDGTTSFGENFGGTPTNPVFNQLSQTNTSPFVAIGDTIYLEGNPTGTWYDGFSLTKKIVIIGTGYFLPLNPKTSNDLQSSVLENLTFNSGSEGSQIIGVTLGTYGITVNFSNILIKRCYFPNGVEVHLNENISDVSILQCFFDNSGTDTGTGIGFSAYGEVTNLRINNNIFKRTLLAASNNSATGGNTYNVLECKNNTFDCPAISGGPSIRMNCASFQNNIIKPTTITLNINSGVASGSVSYNTGAAAGQFDYSATYNNKQVSNMSTLFVAAGTSTDGNYQLQTASAGNYPGADGNQRGAFGNIIPGFRYTLSGLAPIPVIYDVYTPGAVVNGNLQVTIKARSLK